MIKKILLKYLLITILAFSACDKDPIKPVEIGDLSFSRNEFKPEPYSEYKIGNPIILGTFTADTYVPKSVIIDVYSSRDRISLQMYSYHDMPSELFIEAFHDVEGFGLLIVKEANVDVAFDPELRMYTTSQATVNKIIELINNLEGISFDEQLINTPVLTFEIQPNAEPVLLDILRDNKNVQIVEPSSVPSFFKASSNSNQPNTVTTSSRVLTALKGTIFTKGERQNFLAVEPGDTVWAEYMQPNGRVITANTIIN